LLRSERRQISMASVLQSVGSKVAQAVGDKIKQSLDDASADVKVNTREGRHDLTPQEWMELSLMDTKKFKVKQRFEVGEALTNAAANLLGLSWCVCGIGEMPNRYEVTGFSGSASSKSSSNNETQFIAAEASELHGWTGRCLCRPHHKLQMFVQNETGQDILWMDRGCKLGSCFACWDCCRQEMNVYVPGPRRGAEDEGYLMHMQAPSSGAKILASIQEPLFGCTATNAAGLSPALEIMDREGTSNMTDNHNADKLVILQANAVCCIGGLCCDHTFQILDGKNPTQVLGTIVKRKPRNRRQTVSQMVSDSMDHYIVDIPPELPVKTKAAVLSAVHLIDYWMFEGEGDCCAPGNVIRGRVAVKLCNFYCCGCLCPIGIRRYKQCCWCPMIT